MMQNRLKCCGIHIIVFLVARCQLLFMCPFIVPFILALNMRGCQGISLTAVALIGIFSKGGVLQALRYGIIFLILRIFCKEMYCKKNKISAVELAICCGVFLAAVSVSYEYMIEKDLRYVVYSLLEGILAACVLLVYEQGVAIMLKEKGSGYDFQSFIGLVAIGVTAIFGCTQIRMPVDLFITAVTVSVLFSVAKNQIIKHAFSGEEREIAVTDEMLVQKVVADRIYDFGQVFMSMEKMLQLHEADGMQMRRDGLSNVYLCGDGVSLLNAVESQSNRLMEIRRNFIRQVGQVGEAITSFRRELVEPSGFIDYLQERIKERFSWSGVTVLKTVAYEDSQHHLHIFVYCKAKGKRVVTGKKLAEILSGLTGREMNYDGNGEEIIGTEQKLLCFVEAGRFMLTTGVVRKEKKGEACCGDNFSITKLSSQKAMLVISDGMGCGEQAYVESEQIVDLLEQLLEAGFCRELAIDILNSFIGFMADGNMSSSLDLTMIDFYTGAADFVKLGASTTFIKRKKNVECIRSDTLPVGMLEQVEFDTCRRLLYHGDIIVMVSDGILDGVIFENKEEYLTSLIREMDTCNAQVMAKQIMDEIVRMQRKELRDDSTVLVAAVWEK